MGGVYGLTGGTGSGKSTVARLLRDHGAEVIDADVIARQVVEPGSAALAEIRAAFGDAVLQPDGTLDRAALGRLVFADSESRQTLDGIMLPRIQSESARQIAAALAGSRTPVFYDAALLVETGLYRTFAGLVVVTCEEPIRVRRLVERDGLSAAEIRDRMASQLPERDKVAVADHVIDNSGSLADLEAAVVQLLQSLRPSCAPE